MNEPFLPFALPEIGDEEIAEVVSKWTGVPVTRLLEGEMSKLVHLEELVVGPAEIPGFGVTPRTEVLERRLRAEEVVEKTRADVPIVLEAVRQPGLGHEERGQLADVELGLGEVFLREGPR